MKKSKILSLNNKSNNAKISQPEENTLSQKASCAKDNFLSGYTCAQAVIAAFSNEKWFIDSGLTLETAMRLSSSFGGGMGRLREVCGTVSAMFMLAGLAFGFDKPMPKNESLSTESQKTGDIVSKLTKDTVTPINNVAQIKTDHYKRIQELATTFRTENGSIICRELLGLSKLPQTTEQTPNTNQSQHSDQYQTTDQSQRINLKQSTGCVVSGDAYSPIPENRSDLYYKKRPCAELCACAATIFENYLKQISE